MLHEIGVQLGQALSSKGAGFDVIDGPERRGTTTFARERIVIEPDFDGEDAFNPPRKTNAQVVQNRTRVMAAKITIYVKSPSRGAAEWEHRRRADLLLDMVIVAMYQIAVQRKNLFVPKSGKFVLPDDLKETEIAGGAVYELKFTFERGVFDHTWAGATTTTATVSPQMVGGPSVTFSAAAHTITRSFGSFLLDGFAVGQSVIVAGSTSNNGTVGSITVLTDTVMTFASGLVNEGPETGVTITGTGVVLNSTTVASGFVNNSGQQNETANGNGGT